MKSFLGVEIAAISGQAVKKTVLELGGSDPFIVLDDADVEAAATGSLSDAVSVVSAFASAGPYQKYGTTVNATNTTSVPTLACTIP